MKPSHRFALTLTVTAFVGGSGSAWAQPQSMQPAQRPTMAPTQTGGTIVRYVIGPMGHVRGFLLNNGALVFVQGRGGDALAQQAPVGTSVRVEGVASTAAPTMIHRATVYGPNGSVLIAAPLPPQGAVPGAPGAGGFGHGPRGVEFQSRIAQLPVTSHAGVVQVIIPGPGGHIRGFLLSDGTSVFLQRELVRAVNQHGLRPGDSVQVLGRGANAAGVLADQITFADGTVAQAPPSAAMPPAPIAP